MTIKMHGDEHWIIPLNFLSPLWQKLIATILQMKILGLEDRSRQLAQDQCMEWSGGGIPGPEAWDPHIQQPLPSHPSPDLSPSISRTLPPLEFSSRTSNSAQLKKTDFLPNEISTLPLHLSISLIMMTTMFSVIIQIWTLCLSLIYSGHSIQSSYKELAKDRSYAFLPAFPPHSLSLHHHLLP